MPPHQVALQVLAETRAKFKLGSSNIGPVNYDRRSDSYFTVPSLFGQKESSRSFHSLVDPEHWDVNARVRRGRAEWQGYVNTIPPWVSPGDKRRVARAFVDANSGRLGAGNCEEMATSAYLNLINRNIPEEVELVYVSQPVQVDHIFVVIDRPAHTAIGNWRTWGHGTVILDPWINAVFRADQMLQAWLGNRSFGVSPASWTTALQFNKNAFLNTP